MEKKIDAQELLDKKNVGNMGYIPFEVLTASIADLGQMYGVRIASMRVWPLKSEVKFSDMWLFYMSWSGRSAVGWDRMAVQGNADVDEMVTTGEAVGPIFRKTTGHLEQHWSRGVDSPSGVWYYPK